MKIDLLDSALTGVVCLLCQVEVRRRWYAVTVGDRTVMGDVVECSCEDGPHPWTP